MRPFKAFFSFFYFNLLIFYCLLCGRKQSSALIAESPVNDTNLHSFDPLIVSEC